MTVALYARVSSQRQINTQTIDQQLDRLRTRVEEDGAPATGCLVFRDDGSSGTSLRRPGLDALRDAVASAEVERVLITTPDRLARKYVHQVLLLEELERFGCVVEFLDRPMSADPHDQLLLQIRGAVAEYEHPHCRADAAGTAGQAAHRHADALDPGAVWLPRQARPAPRSERSPGGSCGRSGGSGDLRPLPGRRSDPGHGRGHVGTAGDAHLAWPEALEPVELAVDAE